MTPPPPLEWHPYYRSMTWLLDWLEGRGPYAHLADLLVPKLPRLRFSDLDPDQVVPTTAPPEPIRLTRRTARGPAPYVGRPFRYVWPAAVDQYGRCIAGESRMVYL